MQIFLSWSGEQSKAVAEVLRDWIPLVIQATDPWISLDIEKGARWNSEISEKLESSKVGIICLTEDNLDAPWILFEAGALSKRNDAYVCTFLFGIKPTDVQQPLAQFQHTKFNKVDIRRLMETVNQSIQDAGGKALHEKTFSRAFENYWSELETSLNKIQTKKPATKLEQRPEREMLQEILEILREQERSRSLQEHKENVQQILLSNITRPLGLSDLPNSKIYKPLLQMEKQPNKQEILKKKNNNP